MDFMPESPAKNHDQAYQIITGKHTDHSSPGSPVTTTYSKSYKAISSDEEEEDMANCLIMLAHSVSPLNDDKSDDFCCRKTEKLKIRSVTEMTASGGHINTSCYECKTCNRVFQSFQALGGHRASHKKPKLAMENKPEYSKEYQPKLMVVYEENKIVMNKITSPVTADSCSIQTGHKNNNSQTKVHQCSICGSEFLSGQALGGHMRRHRAPLPPSISPTTPPEVGLMNDASDHHVIEKSPVLSLDLNLPPPEVVEDAAGHSSFQFAAGSLQQPLVFSAPALVDCHY